MYKLLILENYNYFSLSFMQVSSNVSQRLWKVLGCFSLRRRDIPLLSSNIASF